MALSQQAIASVRFPPKADIPSDGPLTAPLPPHCVA